MNTSIPEVDHFAQAGSALAGAFTEAAALFDLATVHNPNLASAHVQRLREALLVALLVLGEARRAYRHARAG